MNMIIIIIVVLLHTTTTTTNNININIIKFSYQTEETQPTRDLTIKVRT